MKYTAHENNFNISTIYNILLKHQNKIIKQKLASLIEHK